MRPAPPKQGEGEWGGKVIRAEDDVVAPKKGPSPQHQGSGVPSQRGDAEGWLRDTAPVRSSHRSEDALMKVGGCRFRISKKRFF